MPLDPHVAALIEGLSAQGFQSFEKIGVAATREAIEGFTGLQAPPVDVAEVVPAAYGAHPDQALHVYVPHGTGPFPVVLYVHGGGFVGGSLDVADEPARALATDTGAVVVAATYRKAPESKFPAAHDDAFAALRWTLDHVAEHGGDPTRVAVAGDSAGGNLAAATAVRARDEGLALRALALVNPLIDPIAETASRAEFAEGYLIHLDALAWFGAQYVAAPVDVMDPRLAVNRTPDLAGLPPTLVVTSEYDTLRDEAEEFGELLRAAGVDTEVVGFEGLVHDVYWMSGVVPRCADQRKCVADFLASRLR